MRNTGRNITASLLLLLFVGYWSSVTLFPHVHRIDGHVFVHSHPFSGSSGNPGHNHTPQQFQLIAHLSLLIATAATFVALVFGQAGKIAEILGEDYAAVERMTTENAYRIFGKMKRA